MGGGRAFRGTAWEAAGVVAAQGALLGAEFTFAAAYRSVIQLAGGESAYGYPTGHALGRAALWRAPAAMTGLPAPVPFGEVNALVERLHCVGWREGDDDIWFVHLAMADPEQGIAWTLTGQDFD